MCAIYHTNSIAVFYIQGLSKKKATLNIHEYLLCFTEEKTIGGLWLLEFENNCYRILSAQLS